jgi:hypothetical protein
MDQGQRQPAPALPLPVSLPTGPVACGCWLSHDSQIGYVISLLGNCATVVWCSSCTTVQLSCETSLALDLPPLCITLRTRVAAYISDYWEQLFPDGPPPASLWDSMGPGADGEPLRPNPPHAESPAHTNSPTPEASGNAVTTITPVDAPRASHLPPPAPSAAPRTGPAARTRSQQGRGATQ